MDAFDGAGKPYKGPSFRGGLAIVAIVIVGVALSWLIYSAALNVLGDANSAPSNVTVEERP